MGVTLDPSSDRAFVAAAKAANGVAEKAVRAVQAEGERLIVDHLRTGQDPRGFTGRWDTGKSAQAVQLGPLEWQGTVCRGAVVVEGPPAEHWPVIEGGRKPRRPVSAQGASRIFTWAKRKGIIDRIVEGMIADRTQEENALRRFTNRREVKRARVSRIDRRRLEAQAARMIVRGIRMRGTPGIGPFRHAREVLNAGGALAAWNRVAGGGAPPAAGGPTP